MDAEIQFFMSAKDQQDFLSFVEKQVDAIKEDATALHFIIGDCELNFSASLAEENILYMGRLEIRLGKADIAFQDVEKAKSIFRKLRNWIKKKYFSRLAYINQKGNLIPSRVHWLGPDAKQWKQDDSEKHVLKLSKTSWMIFDIGF